MTAPLRSAMPPAVLTGVTAAVALALTGAVAFLPFLRFAYRAPVLHVVLETAEGMVALFVAYLLYGRFRRTGRVRSLLVMCALVVVAMANLLQALPQALFAAGELTPWVSLAVRALGVVLLTAAALTPPAVRAGAMAARTALVACVAGVLVLGGAGAVLGPLLPPAVDPTLDPTTAIGPMIAGHPALLGAQVLTGLLYAVSSVAFTVQAAREPDELQRWIGAGCALAAVARINYLLFPSLYSDFVYTGDLLRLGFYLFLLIGAMREVQSYWESQSYAAVLDDRRRLARDLHDGLTQELTYIWSQSRLLAKEPGNLDVVDRINGASARALDEARTAIAALTRTSTGSFATVLNESVEGLAGRYGARADVQADDTVELAPEQGDAVLRIVAEAFRNAVRHGGATCVQVALTCPPLTLVVRDDGSGFDASAPLRNRSGGGFGLTSMRERAEGLGAAFSISSAGGVGTTVEVRWP